MTRNSFSRYLAVGALMISVLLSGCAEKKDGSLNDLSETSTEILDNDSRDLSEEIIAPTESPSDSSLGSAEEKLTFETDESESQSSYPPDFYSQTFPPEIKEVDRYGFRSNPQIFSCQITDESLTDDEKLEKAAYTLADEYIKAFYSDSEKCGFRILDHRNVQVDFLVHTIDRDKMIVSEGENFLNTSIGDMEVSEDAWIINIDAEIRFRGGFGAVCNNDPGFSENDWVYLPNQGSSNFYLLYRDGDTYYLWSRDVYHYKFHDENESQSSYLLDHYTRTFPPVTKEVDEYDFRTNPQIFSCQITDESLTDDEKLEKAAYTLADEYIKVFYSDSEKCGFRILDHRNVQVTFLAHTIDRDKMIASEGENFFNTGIGDMEVSENAWIIDINAEIRFRGQFGAFGNNDLGYGEEDWVELPNQGMSSFYLLYRIGDSYCLWSRDVYKYYRWSRDDNNYQ